LVEHELGKDANDRNFLYWLEKWNTRKWARFVYMQIVHEELERQEANTDDTYDVKYYWGGGPRISFVDTPQPNTRRETFVANVGGAGERSRLLVEFADL
jgi:hypothetical protein